MPNKNKKITGLHSFEMPNHGSRLILPTGRSFVTNFLSWSHEHIILSNLFFIFFDTTWDKSMHADELLS